ncbi:MAG: hypothetical protein KAJ60_10480, partial [Desulfobulbaceae bacterium]|nr:hypothetical protein [Desulfobulbaceae bacterium]
FTTPANAFIMRKIYPWLPSYDRAFVRAEPLTRIRDIAHRNDIPQELKKEIKHTLQNKLHRCAGPEDLATSEKILQRITAGHGEYSSDFVEQFKIFHEELLEFFNAGSLEKRLRKMLTLEREGGRAGGKVAQGVERFLAAKEGLENTAEDRLVILLRITELRSILRSILIAQREKNADTRSQNIRLADTGLEDYAFVLLSEVITDFESSEELPWKQALNALTLTVNNLSISGIEADERRVILSELKAWQRKFNPTNRDQLLRLKATLSRGRRLADGQSDLVFDLFFEKAHQLGLALGVASHAIELYCEGEIRGSLIFQLAKLNDLLLQQIRRKANLPSWDVIVPGIAAGRLQVCEYLTDLARPAGENIAVVNKAEGDETIPHGVRGIVLAHHLPHLSHLAIRTRQEGV